LRTTAARLDSGLRRSDVKFTLVRLPHTNVIPAQARIQTPIQETDTRRLASPSTGLDSRETFAGKGG